MVRWKWICAGELGWGFRLRISSADGMFALRGLMEKQREGQRKVN